MLYPLTLHDWLYFYVIRIGLYFGSLLSKSLSQSTLDKLRGKRVLDALYPCSKRRDKPLMDSTSLVTLSFHRSRLARIKIVSGFKEFLRVFFFLSLDCLSSILHETSANLYFGNLGFLFAKKN